uniref:Uncharacterized protein n=1 Tax=Romanomermis culicivorax TaxID=13658 RepID=A0A915I0K6_ROMCU
MCRPLDDLLTQCSTEQPKMHQKTRNLCFSRLFFMMGQIDVEKIFDKRIEVFFQLSQYIPAWDNS